MRKILAGLLLTCVGWTTPALAKETIKIGAILGVTGPAANLGGPEARTLEMLVQEINKKGGIKGNPVELIIKDSSASPEKAISFAKQLIDEDKVFAIIGPSTSGETMKIKTLAEDGKTILLSCAAAEAIVKPVGKYVFKTPQNDSHAVRKIYDQMKKAGISKIGVCPATRALARRARNNWKNLRPSTALPSWPTRSTTRKPLTSPRW